MAASTASGARSGTGASARSVSTVTANRSGGMPEVPAVRGIRWLISASSTRVWGTASAA
jgi:hypothetical protein